MIRKQDLQVALYQGYLTLSEVLEILINYSKQKEIPLGKSEKSETQYALMEHDGCSIITEPRVNLPKYETI